MPEHLPYGNRLRAWAALYNPKRLGRNLTNPLIIASALVLYVFICGATLLWVCADWIWREESARYLIGLLIGLVLCWCACYGLGKLIECLAH